jgi:hypothetical protein
VHPHLFNIANQWGYVLQDSRYESSPLMHDANVLPISQAYLSSTANSSFDATVPMSINSPSIVHEFSNLL